MWLGSSGPLLRGLPTIHTQGGDHHGEHEQPRLVAPARDVGTLGHCRTSVPMASLPSRVASRTMSPDPSDIRRHRRRNSRQLALIEAESNALARGTAPDRGRAPGHRQPAGVGAGDGRSTLRASPNKGAIVRRGFSKLLHAPLHAAKRVQLRLRGPSQPCSESQASQRLRLVAWQRVHDRHRAVDRGGGTAGGSRGGARVRSPASRQRGDQPRGRAS